MRITQIKSIFFKEILDTLRDRRTIMIMIVIPVVLYPALMLFINDVATSQQAKMEQKTITVALINVPKDSDLVRRLMAESKIKIVSGKDALQKVKSGEVHFVVEAPRDLDEILAERGTANIRLSYDRSNEDASVNLDRIRKIIDNYNDDILASRLKEKSLSADYVRPVNVDEINVATKQKMGGLIIGRLLPMLMVVMVLMGAMYPAIDMTAGEKERGTLETILTSPATRAEIVLGKFVAVTLISLLTGLLNLASMTATFEFGIFKQAAAAIQVSIPPIYLITIVGCLIPLSIFFSGMMMAMASFAKSFKEAQNLVMPFYLLSTLPAMVSIVPGVQLEGFWLTMPVANVTLLFKELMLGIYNWNHLLIVLFTAVFLAATAVFLAINLFGREEVLFGGGSSLAVSLTHANIRQKNTPDAAEAFLMCLISMALLLYFAVPMQARDIVSGLIMTEVIVFLALPIAFAKYLKLNLVETFRWKIPSLRSVALTLMMSFGILLCVNTILYFQNWVFPIPKEIFDFLEKVMKQTNDFPVGGAFALIAILPAICEETTFRGVVLSGMLNRYKPFVALIITAALFAAFHLSLHRFFGVFLIGLAASFVVWRSGSIFTGMMIHVINNGIATLFVNYPQYDYFHMMDMQYSIPQFCAGLAIVALCVYLFNRGTKAPTLLS